MTNFKQAPLPFTGQKRNFLKHFIKVLNENIHGQGEDWTIIDVFGGSGLLAHHSKQTKPSARVIYNDFDNYIQRINHIADTNKLRSLIANILIHKPKNSRIDSQTKDLILDRIKTFAGYIDIDCLQSWLLFTGNQVKDLDDFFSRYFYNNIRQSDYPTAEGYLDKVEIVSKSYEILLPEYVNVTKTLLILDPPYVGTMQGAYRKKNYFGMIAFLKLMQYVRPPFIFFSSTRSEIKAYLDFENQSGNTRFSNYNCKSIKATINKNSMYEDNMIFKF